MIDPKMLELSVYEDIPHLLVPVVTDPKKASAALNNMVKEMEDRYRLLHDKGVRNIDSYNRLLEQAKEAEGRDEEELEEAEAAGDEEETRWRRSSLRQRATRRRAACSTATCRTSWSSSTSSPT